MTPFAVFFLRQFFLGISREVEVVARHNGYRVVAGVTQHRNGRERIFLLCDGR